MKRFSQRVGGMAPFSSGLNEASADLRIKTWNLLHPILLPDGGDQEWKTYRASATAIWNHLGWATDEIPVHATSGRPQIKERWLGSDWLAFFDLFEFCVELIAINQRRNGRNTGQWFKTVNSLLEEQGCAYRFIAETLAPITNPPEMAEVGAAAECSIAAVALHIRSAIAQLPPNPKASTRASIKESISAVEAAFKALTDSPSATYGDGLKAFEKRYGPLDASMRRGFDHLYAYTNGPDGIRHAVVEDEAKEVTVADARFMLIACSALANYLVSVAGC